MLRNVSQPDMGASGWASGWASGCSLATCGPLLSICISIIILSLFQMTRATDGTGEPGGSSGVLQGGGHAPGRVGLQNIGVLPCKPGLLPSMTKILCLLNQACVSDGMQAAPERQAALARGHRELGERLAEAGLLMFAVLLRDPNCLPDGYPTMNKIMCLLC